MNNKSYSIVTEKKVKTMISNNYDHFIHPMYQSKEQCENSEVVESITKHQDQSTSNKTTRN